MNAVNLEYNNCSSKINWSAVIAGLAVGLSVEVLLNFLGIGLGLTQLNPSVNSLFNTGVGAIIWLAISGCISLFIAGWVTGRVSNITCSKTRAMNGFIVWCIATLASVFIAATASGVIIGGPMSVVKGTVNITQSSQSIKDTVKGLDNQNQAVDQEDTKEAKDAINAATDNLGKASILMFVAFLLSALTGMGGAMLGKPKDATDTISHS